MLNVKHFENKKAKKSTKELLTFIIIIIKHFGAEISRSGLLEQH